MSARHCIVGAILALSVSTPLSAQTTDVEFFETKIRPVLVQRCYSCHNSKMAAPKGDLILDTKEGAAQGRRVRSGVGAGQAGREPAVEGAELYRPARPDAAERQAR